MVLNSLLRAPRWRLSIFAKLSILIAGGVLATAAAVNEVYVRGANQILIERSLNDLGQEADYFRYPLNGYLKQLKEDVQLAARLQAVQGLVRARAGGGKDNLDGSTEAQWLDRLSTAFEEMLRTRAHYRRVRFIGVGDNGRDILRIERFGNEVVRVADSKFERAGAEPFFQGALRVQPGETYLQDPSLERDQGKVRVPHVLVTRAAVPIYTAEKELFGIVVINMNVGMILQEVRAQLPRNHRLYVANARGDYLVHPDTSKLYASDLGHDHRIQRDDPRLLDALSDPQRDAATFLPEDTARGNVLALRKYRYNPIDASASLTIAVEAPYADIVSATATVSRDSFLFSGALALLALSVGIYLLRLLLRPLNNVADAVVRYRKGEKGIQLPTESPDEIGVLAKEFSAMTKQKDEEDWVKESMVATQRSLLGFKDLSGFGSALLEALVPAVGAQLGALYITGTFARTQHVGETETLNFLSGWGQRLGEGNPPPRSFRWGEGLIGSCARARTRTLITNVPTGYVRIVSATGEAAPRQIVLLPVLFENTLVGVIELATLGEFTPTQLSFLDQLAFTVGVIMTGINASMRTQELLEEARQTAEELQRSEEELKTQQEELEASNEEMEEKTKALEAQNKRIREQSTELEQAKGLIEEKMAELEVSNRYKSEFLANMSHELRTPLNSLLILARGLASNEEGNLTAEQVEEARVIHSGGLELLALINDILDLSKVEAGKVTIVREDIYPGDVAKRMSQQFEPVAKEKNIRFEVRVAEGLPATVHTDVQRLEQILKNLLSNAFKFTQAGSVSLDIRRSVSARDSSDAVSFAVIDTGIGIEEAKLRDIFEAFQQENGSIDRHYGGTGLGLTIARKFAHLLGGEIQVVSAKGQGSTFTLTIPINPSAAAAVPPKHMAPEAGLTIAADPVDALKTVLSASVKSFVPDDRASVRSGDRALLIIEDDRAFAETLIKIGRKRGYKCIAAGDGKSGLLLASLHPVTAVLLDLRLPDIDGLAVLDQLKRDLRTRHIPVHVVSGREGIDPLNPVRRGAVGFLAKPADADAIDGIFSRIEALMQAQVRRVLVIEDDKNTQAAVRSLLKHKGVEISVAENGMAALEAMRSTRFDCVILDLKLPDMTGFQWLEACQKDAGDRGTPPVIVYTAQELSEAENRELNRYTRSIVIKGASSSERLLDEVTLFLHSVESTLSEDQQAMIRMQHDPDGVLQGRTVLLVDDDLRNTFALTKLLKKRGVNVVIADNGEMALDKLKEDQAIELVVMDIMMPVMDGYQAMREIRRNPTWQKLPVIALTARAMPEEQDRCIAAGANDYLVKPVDTETLLSLLRVWLFRQAA